jgi:hypothetical protein
MEEHLRVSARSSSALSRKRTLAYPGLPYSGAPPFGGSDIRTVMVFYRPMWWLGLTVAMGYTIFGLIMIRRRESFARGGARFHQRIARVAPWLFPGRLGTASTSNESWRVLIVRLAVFIIVCGIAFGIVIAVTA